MTKQKININPFDLSEKDRAIILSCLKELASNCDGAADRDGMGFNKLDTDIGKSIAQQRLLSTKQFTIAARLVYKYKRQFDKGLQDYLMRLRDT